MTSSQPIVDRDRSPELEELHQLLERVFNVHDLQAVNLVMAASLPVDGRVRSCPLLCVETDWSKWQTQWIEALYVGMEGIGSRSVWPAEDLRKMRLREGIATMDGLLQERAKRINQQVLVVDAAWRVLEQARKRSRWWEFSQHLIRLRTPAPRGHPVADKYWVELRQAADRVRRLNLRGPSSAVYRLPDWLRNYLQTLVIVNPHLKRWESAYNNLAGMVQGHAELFDRPPGQADWFAGFRLLRDSIPFEDYQLLVKLKSPHDLKNVCKLTGLSQWMARKRLRELQMRRVLSYGRCGGSSSKSGWLVDSRDEPINDLLHGEANLYYRGR